MAAGDAFNLPKESVMITMGGGEGFINYSSGRL